MILVVIMGWGKIVAVLLAAVAVAGVSGCGGEGHVEAESKPSAGLPDAEPTLDEAVTRYQDDLSALRADGCPSPCFVAFIEVYQNSQRMRGLMDASGAAPGVYTEAYALMDELQQNFMGLDGQDTEAARASVLDPANDLDQWLEDNPVK
ncbi:hypothetical protein ACH4LT_10980 [Streptomyces clavifer]|uniref:hypothetical protein n=1 Tax=Streptomyces clavifer TaxID=68188 RepID=UPI0037ABC67C